MRGLTLSPNRLHRIRILRSSQTVHVNIKLGDVLTEASLSFSYLSVCLFHTEATRPSGATAAHFHLFPEHLLWNLAQETTRNGC